MARASVSSLMAVGVLLGLGALSEATWRRRLPGPFLVRDAARDSAGDLLIALNEGPEGFSDNDLIVAKLAGGTGVELWRSMISGPGPNRVNNVHAVAVDTASGDVYGGGYLDDGVQS